MINHSNRMSIPVNENADSSSGEQWDETWDFGTIRPSYGHNTGTRRYATRSASGTMRAININVPGREPLQPLPTMQRPMTPPQTQHHSPKYGGMAKSESSSPKKEGSLQIASREEIELYESDGEPVVYYDFEDDIEDGVGTSTTVKITDHALRSQDPRLSNSGWQVTNTPPVRTPSPPKPLSNMRSTSQVITPAQSRYANSDGKGVTRSSAASSTAVSAQSSALAVNTPRSIENKSKQQPRKYDALEDILLPALDAVTPCYSSLIEVFSFPNG
jgi:hypothetical protein